jgi:uncharacterized lipoprotein NlpE involved in copper resistance
MGTMETGEREVIPMIMSPNKTLTKPRLLRIAQLSSKYTGTAAEAMIGTHAKEYSVCKSRTWAATLYLEHDHESPEIQYLHANEKALDKLLRQRIAF